MASERLDEMQDPELSIDRAFLIPQPLLLKEEGRELQQESTNKVITVGLNLPPRLLNYARELRKNITDAEQLFWELLRNKGLNNWKFRRQHPLKKGFILDFLL